VVALLLSLLNCWCSVSEDETNEESEAQDLDPQFEIVTECWVEPQAGIVCNSPRERQLFEGLDYTSLAETVNLHLSHHLSIQTIENPDRTHRFDQKYHVI